MMKAPTVDRVIRKFSSNTWPFVIFLTAFSTISPPRIIYEMIRNANSTGKGAFASSPSIIPITKNTAPEIKRTIILLLSSLLSLFFVFLIAIVSVTYSDTSTSGSWLLTIVSICFATIAAAEAFTPIVRVCFIKFITEELTPFNSLTSFSILAEQLGQSNPFNRYTFVSCTVAFSLTSTSGSCEWTIASICFVIVSATDVSTLMTNVCLIKLTLEKLTPFKLPTSFSIVAEQLGQSSPFNKKIFSIWFLFLFYSCSIIQLRSPKKQQDFHLPLFHYYSCKCSKPLSRISFTWSSAKE